MKKIIEIKFTDKHIQLTCGKSEIVSIPKDNLTIDGKKLFDNFISKLELTTGVEFDFIDDPKVTNGNDKRIVADIKSIFNNIAKKINDKFKLLAEREDKNSNKEPSAAIEQNELFEEHEINTAD